MSKLSSLTALRAFQICHLCKPTGFPRSASGQSPFPCDFRVLCSAKQLEALKLKFEGLFWSQMDGETCRALQAAVASLARLTSINLKVLYSCLPPQKRYLPLAVFSASPSVQTLSYKLACTDDDLLRRLEDPSYVARVFEGFEPCELNDPDLLRHDCLWRLTCLRELKLHDYCCLDGRDGATAAREVAQLLASIATAQLTSLNLQLPCATMPLTRQIARFSDLQVLTLWASGSTEGSIAMLAKLSGLTSLTISMSAWPKIDRPVLQAEADALRAAIEQSARGVGVKAVVEIIL
jgi:hypothetical protein